MAKGEKRKDCDKCVMLKTPSSFAKGSRVRLKELGNCSKCEVPLAQPLPHNEIILELYGLIPSWDGFSGTKNFTVQDIISLFKLFNISRSLWDDYYHRLTFFHQEYVVAVGNQEKDKKPDVKNQIEELKKQHKGRTNLVRKKNPRPKKGTKNKV